MSIRSVLLAVLALGLTHPVTAAERRRGGATAPAATAAGQTFDVQWHDGARGRALAATVYLPRQDQAAPVILFSHGLGRSREQYAYLGQHWASRGYAVVMVEHPGSDDDVWRGKVRPRRSLRESFEDPATAVNRPLDFSFALTQLVAAHQQQSALGRRLDVSRVAAAGNDLGAQAALVLAGQLLPTGRSLADQRVKAVLTLSPPAPHSGLSVEQVFEPVRTPCLHITGTQDDGLVGDTKAHERRTAFDHIQRGDQFLVTLVGGDHTVYNSHPRQPSREAADARFHHLIAVASAEFFHAYLRGTDTEPARLANRLTERLGHAALVESRPGRPSTALLFDAGTPALIGPTALFASP